MRWCEVRAEITGRGEETERRNGRKDKLLLTEVQRTVAREAPTAVASVYTLTGGSRSCKQSWGGPR